MLLTLRPISFVRASQYGAKETYSHTQGDSATTVILYVMSATDGYIAFKRPVVEMCVLGQCPLRDDR